MDSNEKINKILNFTRDMFLENIKEGCDNEYYKSKVNDIITYFKFKNKEPNEVNLYESNIQNRLGKVDNYIFQKPWNKLSKDCKKIKMNEFIDNYFLDNTKNYDKIKQKILNDLKNNKLNSASKVNYDSLNFEIISLSNLTYCKKKEIYLYN